MKKYTATTFAPFSDNDAQIVGSYIEKKFGNYVTPEMVLEDAEQEGSLLHPYFEWDNNKAAREYRLWQARQIIRCLVVMSNDEPIKAFHNVMLKKGDQSYVSHSTALKSEFLWKQVVEKALQEAQYWASRYKQYKELLPIVRAIQTTKERYEKDNHRTKNRNTTDTVKVRRYNARRDNGIVGQSV